MLNITKEFSYVLIKDMGYAVLGATGRQALLQFNHQVLSILLHINWCQAMQ